MKTKLPRFGAAAATFAALILFASCGDGKGIDTTGDEPVVAQSPSTPGDVADKVNIDLIYNDDPTAYGLEGLAPYLFSNTTSMYYYGTLVDGDGTWTVTGTTTNLGFNVGTGQTNSISVPNGIPFGIGMIQQLTSNSAYYYSYGDRWSARPSPTGTAVPLRYIQRYNRANGQPVAPQNIADMTRTVPAMTLFVYTNNTGANAVQEFTGSDSGTNFQGVVYSADLTFMASVTMPVTCNLISTTFNPGTGTSSSVTVANGSGTIHMGLLQNGYNDLAYCYTTKTTAPGIGTQIPVAVWVNVNNVATGVLIGREQATYYIDTALYTPVSPSVMFQVRAVPTALDVIDQVGNNTALILQ